MSDEKVTEKPPVPPIQEKAKEPTAPKTSQSAFDKVMEQQKIIQQSPLAQGKIAEQGASSDHKVKEITKWQEHSEDKRQKDDREDNASREKTKQKERGSETVTREAITRGGEKKGFGGGSDKGGKGSGGFGGDFAKRQIVQKKLSDLRGMIGQVGQSNFAGKLAGIQAAQKLSPQQMQGLVNQIVQAIHIGTNELGWAELKMILREHVFKGLRLRLTSKGGKVSIQFDTADRGVKDLFNAESGKIRKALEEKGIAVQEIKVT